MARDLDKGVHCVRVSGIIQWHGATLACPHCGKEEGLLLAVIGAEYGFGERAWAECGGRMCSAIYHPLIYPQFVRAIKAWDQAPEGERPPMQDVLDGLGWQPHRIQYVPWVGDGTASDDEWLLDYPELVEAARRRANGDQA